MIKEISESKVLVAYSCFVELCKLRMLRSEFNTTGYDKRIMTVEDAVDALLYAASNNICERTNGDIAPMDIERHYRQLFRIMYLNGYHPSRVYDEDLELFYNTVERNFMYMDGSITVWHDLKSRGKYVYGDHWDGRPLIFQNIKGVGATEWF